MGILPFKSISVSFFSEIGRVGWVGKWREHSRWKLLITPPCPLQSVQLCPTPHSQDHCCCLLHHLCNCLCLFQFPPAIMPISTTLIWSWLMARKCFVLCPSLLPLVFTAPSEQVPSFQNLGSSSPDLAGTVGGPVKTSLLLEEHLLLWIEKVFSRKLDQRGF